MEATDNFSMDCPNCGPNTILFVDGEMVPHSCDYTPPSVAVEPPSMSDLFGPHEDLA